MPKPFDRLVVIEIAGSVSGGYAGKLFAGFGATVLLIEPPGGAAMRREGEQIGEYGTVFAYLATGKRSIALDMDTTTGYELLKRLLARADVVIESSSPEPMLTRTEVEGGRGLVHLFISPFGIDGCYAGYRSTPFTDYAAGGQMFVTGEPDREPLQGAGRQPEYAAGTYGFIATMAALRYREQSGAGQRIDVSHIEAMASMHQWTSTKYTHTGTIERRIGNRYSSAHPITIYPCKDGHVAISAANDEATARLLAVMGRSDLLADPRFATGLDRLDNYAAFDAEILPWLLDRTVAEIVAIGQEVRVPVGPVPGLTALLEDEHLAARDFWEPLTLGGVTLRYPGPPFRLSRHAWQIGPPPHVGADTATLLSEVGARQLDALRQAGVIGASAHE